jgi:methylenetetrahydrofolate dehydrogenase (NADP+)/methenyltetrahydrofolate cyclohydrolase
MELAPRAAAFAAARGRPPALGVVLAGQRPESEIYVRNKLKAVAEAGCRAELIRLDEQASLDDALATVKRLNEDATIDAILVQSPLPPAMGVGAEQLLFDTIDPAKDVDGFHPANVGRLVQNRPHLVACTPLGCIELLEREQIPLRGKHAVVIGRSNIVGKPMALLLLHSDATDTVCHSRTVDLPHVAASADVLVAAVGRPGFVTAEFVKPGATVIDVGINVVSQQADAQRLFPPGSAKRRAFEQKGSVLAGDVHPDVEAIAGALTPVPGGIGPLTIAMVLRNTITAAEARS